MQKKSKTILTAVVTALFVLSISYFALLAPTTAWYYQTEDKNYSFQFGDFNANAPITSSANLDVRLRGATRFADSGELLFDEMTHVIKVTATNTGRLAGCVTVNVKQGALDSQNNMVYTPIDITDSSGLKWFIFSSPTVIADPAAQTVAQKGAFKTQIETMLTAKNATWPLNYKTSPFNGYTGATKEAKYEAYNTAALAALKAHNDTGVLVPPSSNDPTYIYVVFWAEYGNVKTALDVDASETARTITDLQYNNLQIEVIAKPDTGANQRSTLTVTNTSSADVNVSLFLMNDSGSWTAYTGAYVATANGTPSDPTNASAYGEISVPGSNGTAQIANLTVGTRYKLVISSTGLHFNNSDPAKLIDETGFSITGTVSNDANAITIAANA